MILVLVLAAMTFTACSDAPSPATSGGRPGPGNSGGQTREQPQAVVLEKRPTVQVGSAAGGAGEVVSLDVALVDGQGVLVATATDLRYAAGVARVVQGSNGQPDCELNPALGSGGAVKKQLFAREKVGDGEAVLRVGILGVDNANPLPDGPLFACRFEIDEKATLGPTKISAVTEASDARARAIAVQVSSGEIVVN